MPTYEQNYNLIISVDAGFDGVKVCINGHLFTVESQIVKTKTLNFMGNMKNSDHIAATFSNTSYLIGTDARKYLNDSSTREEKQLKIEEMSDIEFLTSIEGERLVKSAIAYSLVQYSKITKEKNLMPKFEIEKGVSKDGLFEIYFIIGYPNSIVDDTWKDMKNRLSGETSLSLEVGEKTYEINYFINPENTMAMSQAKAAFLGTLTDDKGKFLPENHLSENQLPGLLIDGGQKTVGMFGINRSMAVTQEESNTDFAMNNVYERILKDIHKLGRKDIQLANIADYIKGNSGILKYEDEDGYTKSIDIKELYKKYNDEVCDEMIDYINEHYNKMLDLNSIVISGGTGAAYYERFYSYVREKKGQELADNIYLTDYEFNGHKISPIYGITVGLYKALVRAVPKQGKKQATKEKES